LRAFFNSLRIKGKEPSFASMGDSVPMLILTGSLEGATKFSLKAIAGKELMPLLR